MAHAIRQQLRLSEIELTNLLECTLDRAGYIALLQSKNII